jgi:hypothetical protein
MRLPNFLILGAQKSGTSSLHAALSHHPQVFMSHPKEIIFFNDDDNYQRGLKWYSSFFNKWGEEKVAGESTPSYLWDERVPSRIKQVLPKAKFIVLLRNPIERAYSAYWFAFIGGNETLSFEEGLAMESVRAKQGDKIKGYSSYVDRGIYAQQLKRYFKLFPVSQFLFIITEEYKENPTNTLKKVTEFLEIECSEEFLNGVKSESKNISRIPRSYTFHKCVPFLRRNFNLGARIVRRLNLKTGKYPPMAPETRVKLSEQFSESIIELENLIGRSLDIWNHNTL